MRRGLWIGLALLLALAGCKNNSGGGSGTGGTLGGSGISGGSGVTGGAGSSGGAGTSVGGSGTSGGAGTASGAVTFSMVYKDVIVATGCNGGALCHGGTVGKLTMNSESQAYDALVGVDAMGTNLTMMGKPECKDSGLKRVVAGMPDKSLMMLKVQGSPPCGDAMPPTGGALAAEKVQLIRNWIMGGAVK